MQPFLLCLRPGSAINLQEWELHIFCSADESGNATDATIHLVAQLGWLSVMLAGLPALRVLKLSCIGALDNALSAASVRALPVPPLLESLLLQTNEDAGFKQCLSRDSTGRGVWNL